MQEATKRLRKEYANIVKDPPPNIIARPSMSNILEWHYVIYGLQEAPYEGGQYHGKVKFPPEYPHKPPSIMMVTPNGRFAPNSRLCFSMSDFHPETWNPLWSVSTILTGLISFMLSSEASYGTIPSSLAQKRNFARLSKAWNSKNPTFRKIFPDLLPQTEPATTQPDVPETQQNNPTSTHDLQQKTKETPTPPTPPTPTSFPSITLFIALLALICLAFVKYVMV
eukprot:TRINITY_DN21880_c0_g1_i1.p1 TRINITY_DN21880_c0_g1~~TRINITY_DN21880_c0_g1_i1.p1  ORF type:complete len:231 (+),score=48.08 TRINITY_DN21880_c0_g1_i1:22-693(+)